MKKVYLAFFTVLLFLFIPGFISAEELTQEQLEDLKVDHYKTSIVEVESAGPSESYSDSKPLDNEGASLSSVSWKRVTWQQDAYSRANVHLFRFTYQVYWEWDSNKITRVVRSSTPSIYAMGWRYDGLNANTGYYYNSNKNYYTKRQGHFVLGTGGWDVQHSYPWIQYDIRRGGSYSYARGW
ncbi:hypothetical protein QGM71_20545 [Virgibacillus sp. C22-A2]|uniref:Uncharacterized protein n=1 Tax=Virgibacillus tibetensis TaxID=3042313 RepID=A0ABU6KKL7_9BACI|nr:hypothetical protein [Virgibacillus sp. C22-A2]